MALIFVVKVRHSGALMVIRTMLSIVVEVSGVRGLRNGGQKVNRNSVVPGPVSRITSFLLNVFVRLVCAGIGLGGSLLATRCSDYFR